MERVCLFTFVFDSLNIMKFTKYILIPLLPLTLLLISCKKQEAKSTQQKDSTLTEITTTKGTFPVVLPFENNLPKQDASYCETKKKQIEQFYKKNWANNSMNGGFLVAKEGQIIYEQYQGYADLENHTPITNKTPIHIASVSKVLTATLVLKLIDAGKISLDQKVNTILPSFPYPNITIKTLLNHRSGLKNYAYFTNERKVWNPQKNLTNQNVLEILNKNKIPLEFPTNTRFSYSNTNYAMLALVIEKITGLSYKEAMKKMVFDPLQMNDTYVFDITKDKETATPSYKWNNQKYAFDYLDGVNGDKNIYSTPRDLLKLDLARRSGHFVNPDLEKKIYKGYSYEHYGAKNYGLGVRMIEWETGNPFYFHNGWWHGNTSSYITMGKEKVTIIVLSNKFNHATYKAKNLAVLFGDYPFKLNEDEKEE